MMQMHYFLRNLRLAIGKVGHLYLPRIREKFFAAAWLPLNTILGNWASGTPDFSDREHAP
jgi:hypothetical protein